MKVEEFVTRRFEIARRAMPWQVKLISKIAVSQLPIPYRFWRRMTLFRHGQMESPAYAHNVFLHHATLVGLTLGQPFVALELGPGDSAFSGLIARAYGAELTYLVDVGFYIREDLRPYHKMLAFLEEHNLRLSPVRDVASLNDLLDLTRTCLLTEGLSSLRSIPDRSVDFVWSQAVVEHINRDELPLVAGELRRLLKPSGVASHRVDLTDHLSGRLENLRFSPNFWESRLLRHSGIYTNRFRLQELASLFSAAGFVVTLAGVERWERIPTPRELFHGNFARMSDEELTPSAVDLVLRPQAL